MLLRTLTTGILLTAAATAQINSFPKLDYFRETFRRAKTEVEIKDPVRLKDYVVDGKLELSLKDYLSLVMANNTNIQVQMLTIETPKNAIQRAFGAWDPVATANFNNTRNRSPVNNQNEGAAIQSTLNQPFSAQFTQLMDTGTNYTVQFNGSKFATNSDRATFNPTLSSNLRMSFTQPLLRDRGRYVNRLNLMVARSNLRVSEYALRNTLIQAISDAENAYWQVVLARESLKVAETGRKAAADYLEYMQRQLDLGALSPLDIYNPKQRVAEADLQVAQQANNLQTAEDALRLQIAADLDPAIRTLPIVLTEPVELPNADSLVFEPETSVQAAFANRPNLKAASQRLDVDDLQIQTAKNALLPRLNLIGYYQTQGLGGVFLPNGQRPDPVTGIIPSVPGGLGDALSQMFHFGFPGYQFGLQLTLPIRNRAASMDLADAVVRKKSDALQLRQAQEAARLSVLNAITNINGSKEQLKLAKIQRDFSEQNYKAMLQKYELGAENNQNVITAQQNLTQSENNVVQNQINLRRSILNLQQQTGELLDARGIVVQ